MSYLLSQKLDVTKLNLYSALLLGFTCWIEWMCLNYWRRNAIRIYRYSKLPRGKMHIS